ncbi:MAG: hypothetical protein GY784_04640 [Gammaproteobacteria bacterium]|nr:hypothetical protein [Gammaproteobacteria bacterium]MCP3863781.1 hypothetical protein [Aestuariibacter sp.]MCP4527365.1 hypothetical protein [Aestuariibacter sp.]MCP4949311.1 hypothetical protein [Aestuariibacter sp.]MCP5012692.1 hypothetical protein [Aestuariibacter sp.]
MPPLVQYVRHKTGLDPRDSSISPPSTRHGASQVNVDEKGFNAAVFSHLLRVARVNGDPIKTIHGDAVLPVGCFLTVAASHLDLAGEVVVVVENGDVMSHLHELRWPNSLCNALFIYRGHSKDVNELKNLLKESPPKQVLGFFDFDPAGLLMGLEDSMNFSGLVLPDIHMMSRRAGLRQLISQSNVFFAQSEQLNRLKLKISSDLSESLDFIVSSNVAIMQESMASHNVALVVVPLRNAPN